MPKLQLKLRSDSDSSDPILTKHEFYDDPDLKTPKHDEIFLWLDKNIESVVKQVINWSTSWKKSDIAEQKKVAKKMMDDKIDEYIKEIDIRKRYVSAAIEIRKRFNKDDTDVNLRQKELDELVAEFQEVKSWSELGALPSRWFEIKKVDWQVPIDSSYRLLFFIDIIVNWNFGELAVTRHGRYGVSRVDKISPTFATSTESGPTLAFIIKSEIPSLCQLIRQINICKESFPKATFCVVSPDDQFAIPLRSRDIVFVHYLK